MFIAKTSVRPLALPISSKANLAPSPPFRSCSPFPKTKTGHYRIKMIQSSRLHHWLPLPQVPIYTGRSSEPLPSRVFVNAGYTTPCGQKIQYSREHNKIGSASTLQKRWLEHAGFVSLYCKLPVPGRSLPGLVCLFLQVGLCTVTRETFPSHSL